MTTLIRKLRGSHSPAEVEDELRETARLPIALVGLVVLCLATLP